MMTACNESGAAARELFRREVDSTGGVVIVAFLDDNASSVDVPAQIDGKPVVGIGDRAFFGRSPDLTFDVAAGAYAEEYARANGIRFEVY